MSMYGRFFNWSRRRKCSVCGEEFQTMGGSNVTKCVICRNTADAERERHERQLKAQRKHYRLSKIRKRRMQA